MRIAVISRLVPRANFQSGDRRFIAFLEILARQHDVHFLGYHPPNPEEVSACDALRSIGISVHESGWQGMTAATIGVPFDLALFEFFHAFETWGTEFRRRQPGAVLVIDSVDIHFAREAAAAAVGLIDEGRVAETRERELAAYRAVDAVLVVSDEEAELLRAEAGLPPIFVIPNIVPVRDRSQRQRTRNALFVGSFRHPPNLDAVQWFVREVWPLVRSVVRDATFRVAGAEMPPSVRALADHPGVELLGRVPDTAPYLDEALISVAPLRFGAGMKGKVNEAMAAGVPVVSTRYGVQGLPVVSGVHALVADDPRSFADALIRLFGDPAAADKIGLAGQELAQRFSPDRVAALVYAMCDQVVAGQRRSRVYVAWLLAQLRIAWAVMMRRLGQTMGL